jgi:DNA-binding transcriptional MerR regulator
MEEKKYTIEQLGELTGFSRRTIRYYIQEGLLDPPAGRGRGGFYFDSHLATLMAIKSYQSQGLRLGTIQKALHSGQQPAIASDREIWVQYAITQGVELHVRRDMDEKNRENILQAVQIVKSLITKKEDTNE